MASDPRKLRPGALCQLLNSTPLGEVIDQSLLRNHRTRAGIRIGEGQCTDLLRYVAWLIEQRHAPKSHASDAAEANALLYEAAEGAAALGSHNQGADQEVSSKQQSLIAALMTEPTHAAAAQKVGISTSTVYRWLNLPHVRAAYRQARRELVESSIGRLQAASGQSIDALLEVTRHARRDSDRVRAAVAILDRAFGGLREADVLYGDSPAGGTEAGDTLPVETEEIARIVAARLRQVDQSELSTAEKSRLTSLLADALLRAISVDVLDKRLEALQNVLLSRKESS